MLRKIGLIVFAVIILQSSVLRNDSFDRYRKLLKVIDLPISFSCLEDFDYPDYSNIPAELDKKYRPMGHKTLGRIDLNKNFISIIQVAQSETEYPIIFNYNTDGTQIASLGLYSGSCSSFPPESSVSSSFINHYKIVSMTDTTSYFRLNKEGDRVGICDSIIIRYFEYKMDDSGQFRLFNNKRIKK